MGFLSGPHGLLCRVPRCKKLPRDDSTGETDGMSIWRHAITAKWLAGLGVAILFAAVTTMFGLWQWDRRGQAVAEIERIEKNFDQSPVAFADVLAPGNQWSDELRWRPVTVEGTYATEHQLLVRTRPRGGAVGFEVVIPLVSSNGEAVLVNRGWVPTGEAQDLPDSVPEAPDGVVTVTGRLLPGEPDISGRTAPEGQLATINLARVAEATGIAVDPRAYMSLVSEQPPVTPTPVLQPRPALDEGPHLSYTFQWFLFGLLGFIAWGYLVREDFKRGLDRPEGRQSGRDRDQDIEDALLDEAEAFRG